MTTGLGETETLAEKRRRLKAEREEEAAAKAAEEGVTPPENFEEGPNWTAPTPEDVAPQISDGGPTADGTDATNDGPEGGFPIGGGRSSSGTQPQAAFDERNLSNTTEGMDLYMQIEIKEANAEAAKRYTKAVTSIKKALFEDMGLKDGQNYAIRILDKRIVIVGATGDSKPIMMDRKPITKIHIETIKE